MERGSRVGRQTCPRSQGTDCIQSVQESERKDCRYWNPLTRLSQLSDHWTVELNIEPGGKNTAWLCEDKKQNPRIRLMWREREESMQRKGSTPNLT